MKAEIHACLMHHFNCIVWKVVWVYWKFVIFVFSSDRARVAGGLPDVVTIQEGKVVYMVLHMVWKKHICATPQIIFPQKWQKIKQQQQQNILFSVSFHLSLHFSLVGFEPDLQYLGWPCTRGHLAKEWTWDGFGRSLYSEVWVRQVCQFHHHQRQYVWLWQVQHPGKEQVRYGERRFHRKCLHARRGTWQEKIKKTNQIN